MKVFLPLPPLRHLLLPALVALIAGGSVVATIDPAGSYPGCPQGPGLTLDESFNVQQGVFLVHALREYGVALVHPESVREVFGHRVYPPAHPPLGRLWLGAFHEAARAVAPPHDPGSPYVTACARTGSAAAYGLLVFLVGVVASRWYGGFAGGVAALALLLMPRLFGHAHLAALETVTNLTYAAAVLSVAAWWTGPARPTWKIAGATGLVFGLALLTKMQAVLLPVPVVLWALGRWRTRALTPLVVWTLAGLLVFFAGWPWLWLDPPAHLGEYFARTTERATLHVWYLGERYADRAVPWHYPFVLFGVTVPLGLQLLGAIGLTDCRSSSPQAARNRLLAGAILVPLIVFAFPGVAVYDGARLFLVVFAIWAVFVGRGTALTFDWLKRRTSAIRAATLVALPLLVSCYGHVRLHSCQLSYYNLAVGTLRGAEVLGFEPTYWGDSLTRDLLVATEQHVPAGSELAVTPVLHQFQLEEMVRQSPPLRDARLRLRPWRDEEPSRYLLLFRRRADLPESLRDGPADARLLAEVRRAGVQLAALYEISPDSP